MNVYCVKWQSEDYKDALKLRDQLLRIPLGMSIYDDPLDKEVEDIHFVYKDKEVLGTCFYRIIDHETMQMKQVTVKSDMQHQHIGKQLFLGSLVYLKAMGIRKIEVHARAVALGFYQKLGFIIEGEPFEEVGMKHYSMYFSIPPTNTKL